MTTRTKIVLGILAAAVIVPIILAGGVGIYLFLNYERLEGNYQSFADNRRLHHLIEIADLIERYHEETGHYPLYDYTPEGQEEMFGDSRYRIEAIISHRDVPDMYFTEPVEFGHSDAVVPVSVLEEALREKFGEDTVLPDDPQNVPSGFPNLYVYVYQDGDYFVAIHLYAANELTFRLGEHYYKLQVGNYALPDNVAWEYENVRDKILNDIAKPDTDYEAPFLGD